MGLKTIIKRIFKRKIKRELDVVHCYTFGDGVKLYTYKENDYGKIKSRYYDNIQELINNIILFGVGQKEIESLRTNIVRIHADVLAGKLEIATSFNEIVQAVLYVIDNAGYLKNQNQSILEQMFCMFYILEDEIEMGYDVEKNKTKINYLKTIPINDRDFFLNSLERILKNWLPTSKEDTNMLLQNLNQTMEIIKGLQI